LAVTPIFVRKIMSAKDTCTCHGRSHCETTSQERTAILNVLPGIAFHKLLGAPNCARSILRHYAK
jgi:hypothetical protein